MRFLLRSLLISILVVGGVQCMVVKSVRDYLVPPASIHQRIYISKNIDAYETQAIVEAAQEWETATNGLVSVEIVPHFDGDLDPLAMENDVVLFENLPFDDPYIRTLDEDRQKENPGFMTLAFYHQRSIIPTVEMVADRITNLEMYRRVAMHELGHSYCGPEHNPQPNTVMYFNDEESSAHLTCSDLEMLCSAQHCDAHLFPACRLKED
jgi:hypothetical protein